MTQHTIETTANTTLHDLYRKECAKLFTHLREIRRTRTHAHDASHVEHNTTPYISFSTVGMPLKNQINATQGVKRVYSYLNRVYEVSLSRCSTWYNKDITLQIEITGCTGYADVIFSKVVDGRWKAIKTVSVQDYYNEINEE